MEEKDNRDDEDAEEVVTEYDEDGEVDIIGVTVDAADDTSWIDEVDGSTNGGIARLTNGEIDGSADDGSDELTTN